MISLRSDLVYERVLQLECDETGKLIVRIIDPTTMMPVILQPYQVEHFIKAWRRRHPKIQEVPMPKISGDEL